MRAVRFQTRPSDNRSLEIPAELAAQIPRDQPLQVILLLPEGSDERGWDRLTWEQFLEGYSESDGIYDSL
jgi:hypothetical protein